jgi:hypothetical protein
VVPPSALAVSLEPQISITRGQHGMTVGVPIAISRSRFRIVPDLERNGHGDAAFATAADVRLLAQVLASSTTEAAEGNGLTTSHGATETRRRKQDAMDPAAGTGRADGRPPPLRLRCFAASL